MDKKQIIPRPDFIPEFNKWEKFKDASIGITGHRGVLGRIIFERFTAAGTKIDPYHGDILDIDTLRNWFQEKQFSHFFHFAAFVPVAEVEKNPLKAFEVNAVGVFNICKQLLTTQKNCWTFFASTSHIYKPVISSQIKLTEDSKAEPISVYGQSKYVGDMLACYLLEKADISYCVGRIFSYTHSSQQEPYLVATLKNKINKLKDGETLHLINPDSIRDIMDAENVIDAILGLAARKYKGVINIASGKGRSIMEIAKLLVEKLHRNLTIAGENKSTPDSMVADVSELQKLAEI